MGSKAIIGAVVIGRNEGLRLLNCLDSLKSQVEYIVYVDSASTDNSLEEAQKRGINCISLDLSIPFTAARARNEGFQYLTDKWPNINYIQFIDGDCEIDKQWINKAIQFLSQNKEYAIVSGRLRERFPEYSIYNKLMDIEWDTPIGDALACGGIAMIRVEALNQVKGFRNDLIAGEEPEMCFRMRTLGWKIYRLDADMAKHDAAMTKFSQWWKRNMRAGYAYANAYFLHGNSNERFRAKDLMRIMLWSFVFPMLIISLTFVKSACVLLILVYPIQILRLAFRYKVHTCSWKIAFLRAWFVVIGKFPQFFGCLKFTYDMVLKRKSHLIEYK